MVEDEPSEVSEKLGGPKWHCQEACRPAKISYYAKEPALGSFVVGSINLSFSNVSATNVSVRFLEVRTYRDP